MKEYSEKYWSELLNKYRNGNISTDERFQLEKRALDDPFLFDALEGFSLMGQEESEKAKPTRLITIPRIAAAASIIMLFSVVFLMKSDQTPNTEDSPQIAMKVDTEVEQTNTTPKSESSEIIEKSNNDATIASTPSEESTTSVSSKTTISKNTPVSEKSPKANQQIVKEKSKAPKKVQRNNDEEVAMETAGNTMVEQATKSHSIDLSQQEDTIGEMANTEEVIMAAKKKRIDAENGVAFYVVEPAIGNKDFQEYVKENVKNRGLAQSPPQSVTIEFKIDKDGMLSDFTHIFDGCPECGAYAIYLLSNSGVWKTVPAGQEGKARYTLTF